MSGVRKRGNPKEQAKLFLKAAQFGEYLTKLRTEQEQSLSFVGKKIGVSSNYLSEIERGLKTPSDEVLRELAKYYDIPEHEIFDKIGRVPLQAREELEENEMLQRTLVQIRKKNLSEDKKQKLYEEVYRIYTRLYEEGEPE